MCTLSSQEHLKSFLSTLQKCMCACMYTHSYTYVHRRTYIYGMYMCIYTHVHTINQCHLNIQSRQSAGCQNACAHRCHMKCAGQPEIEPLGGEFGQRPWEVQTHEAIIWILAHMAPSKKLGKIGLEWGPTMTNIQALNLVFTWK